jgi:dipeptidyl aminopeptidase/acylaminoacyl peptidase
MRKLLCLLFVVASLPVWAQKRVINHEDVWMMKRTGEPVLSPDGRHVVFSLVEPDYDPAKQVSDLWLVPADGSAPPRRLTATRAGESSPVWSPDSTRIAFTARREGDETAQVYILPLTGGEAVRLTSSAAGAANPKWSPDGKSMLFESQVYPGAQSDADNRKIAAERKARKYNARAYEAFPVRYWNVWLDDTTPHIFVQAVEGNAPARDLLAGSKLAASPGFGGPMNPLSGEQVLQPAWSPDGREVIFTAYVNRQERMFSEVESHLFRVAAAGGEPLRISTAGQSFGNPRFSPDSKSLYALHSKNPEGGRLYSISRLARFAWPPAGAHTLVAGGWDRSVSSFTISADSGTLYIEAEDDGYDKLFRLAASGGTPAELLPAGVGGYTGPQAAGATLIARYGGSVQPPEVALIDAARGTHKLLTNFNAARLAELDLAPPEHFWFTAKNGKRIHSILTYPPRFDKSKKYPLVVFPHGGPNSMSKDSFSTRWNFHLLVSQGYVMLQTNYTGSTGFGEKFADDIERDVLRGPAIELLEAIEEAVRRYPFIDRTRQAAIGASYGGYLMNWFNGHTTQFRCLVNHAGAVNNESQYGVNDGGYDRELRMGGPIWEKGGQWLDQSPIRYSKNFRTPMLITQGELDFRVPLSESMTTFKLLQRLKVPTKVVFFPEEGHWILRGENNRYHMQEVLGWLKKYLEPADPIWRTN